MAENAQERRVGTWIREKWYVERLLGRGGTAAVYAAKHKIGREVALKILHREHLENAELCERFQREALAANKFDHPSAVEITDVDVADDGAPFLVMELVRGETLADRIDAHRNDVGELCRLMVELLELLAEGHARGIIHRDVKPQNLVIEPSGRLRVLDFGVAKLEGSKLTGRGEALGTVAYMAPEQLRGEAIDARVDVFGVGATMFHALAGRPIHLGTSTGEIVFAAVTGAPPKLTSVANVDPALAAVVDKALAFDRTNRYADALSMKSEIDAYRAKLGR